MPILDATAALAAARSTASARDASAGPDADDRLVVVTLCAAWCHTCGEFRAALEPVAEARPTVRFVWLDIEDDAELCGDVDVENFPTLVAFRRGRVLHHGVTLPHGGVVARLVDELAMREHGLPDPPHAIAELSERLA